MDDEEFRSKVERDLWFGNGKPGLTIRMQQREDDHKALSNSVDGRFESVNKIVQEIRSDIRRVVWLVLAAVIATVLKLILTKGL